MKKLLTILMFLIVIGSFVSASVTITIPPFDMDLVGGDSKDIYFTVYNGFSGPVEGYMGYVITQENGIYNGSEAWIEFSENPILLDSYARWTSYFTIKTAQNIVPDRYNICLRMDMEFNGGGSSHRRSRYKGTINICGDGECGSLENCERCPEDCGVCEVELKGGGDGGSKDEEPDEIHDLPETPKDVVEPQPKKEIGIIPWFLLAMGFVIFIFVYLHNKYKKKPKKFVWKK